MDDMHKHTLLYTYANTPCQGSWGVRAIILAPHLADTFISIAGGRLGRSLAKQARQQMPVYAHVRKVPVRPPHVYDENAPSARSY